MAVIVVLWIILALVIGGWGGNRKIGFAGAFFISLLFSPVIGLIVTAISAPKDFSQEEADRLNEQAVRLGDEGKYQEAIDMLKKALQKKSMHPLFHYNIACYYSMLNKVDLALQHLGRAVENGYSDFENIEKKPELENLRNSEKFAAFADKGYRLS